MDRDRLHVAQRRFTDGFVEVAIVEEGGREGEVRRHQHRRMRAVRPEVVEGASSRAHTLHDASVAGPGLPAEKRHVGAVKQNDVHALRYHSGHPPCSFLGIFCAVRRAGR